LFPLVPQKQLVHVYKWPNPDYDPSEIYKLSLDSAFDSVDDTFESTMTVSGMVHTKRKGRKEDYKSPTVWSTAFLLWQAIRVTYSKDIDLNLKLHKFHAKIMRLAATYTWDGVLNLAIHLHTVYYNDSEASWTIPDDERDARCIRRPPPPTKPTAGASSARRLPNICYNWNAGKCPSPCSNSRRHDACSFIGCNEPHQSYLHHKAEPPRGR
jgi:hypothetical protein